MKLTFSILSALLSLQSFAQQSYVIHGKTDKTSGIAILGVYDHPADTVQIVNGQFEFRGKVAGPRYQSFQVPPARVARMVLEPGDITVSHTENKGYVIGGTANNVRMQKMDEEVTPYYQKLEDLWKKYNAASGEERARLYDESEDARNAYYAKIREMILADSHYSGFLEMLPQYRNESADVLKKFVDEFREFQDDDGYKRLLDFYHGAAQTAKGIQAPDWTRPDEKGSPFTLSSLKGKYVLLDFWYSGCHWCRKMTPHLKSLYPELRASGLEIVSISVDPQKDEAKWRKAMEEDGAPWEQVWDKENKLPEEYGVVAYPTMFLLDKEGKVVEKLIGYREEPAFRELFSKYVPISEKGKETVKSDQNNKD